MKFTDLPRKEQETLRALGDEIAAEMEAMDDPSPDDPTSDPRWDPVLERRRIAYRDHIRRTIGSRKT